MAGRRAGYGAGLVALVACALGGIAARADETYAIFDAVFLQRDIGAGQRPLVTETVSGAPAIRTDDLTFSTQPGMRLFYGRKGDCAPGWEVGYLGVWGMFGEDANVSAVNTLQAANPLGLQPGVLNDAGVARATYRSSLNSAEANVFSRWCDGGYDRTAGEPWRRCDNYDGGTIDWLAGFSGPASTSRRRSRSPRPRIPAPASTPSRRRRTSLHRRWGLAPAPPGNAGRSRAGRSSPSAARR